MICSAIVHVWSRIFVIINTWSTDVLFWCDLWLCGNGECALVEGDLQTGPGSQSRTSGRCPNQHWCASKCWDLKAHSPNYALVFGERHQMMNVVVNIVHVHLAYILARLLQRPDAAQRSIPELRTQLSPESRHTSQDFQLLRVTKGPTNPGLVAGSSPETHPSTHLPPRWQDPAA